MDIFASASYEFVINTIGNRNSGKINILNDEEELLVKELEFSDNRYFLNGTMIDAEAFFNELKNAHDEDLSFGINW